MALSITGTRITSRATDHTATAWPVPGEPALWTVTWLPGRNLTYSQAVSAMRIAQAAGRDAAPSGDDPVWKWLDGWAAELGLDAHAAVAQASVPPPEPAAGE